MSERWREEGKPTGLERDRARAEEWQGRMACGGFVFDGDGTRKKKKRKREGGSFSESDCTLRRGGVYPANRADQGNANYSATVKTAQIISSSHSSVFCNCWEPV